MRLVLLGGGSFIARHLRTTASKMGIEALSLPHDAAPGMQLHRGDVLINFALAPDYKTKPYAAVRDMDLDAARCARDAGVRFAFLSTRRVYPAEFRWNARECDPASGDETVYGRNKAATEAAINQVFPENCVTFRLSNIFGFEYEPDSNRRSFFSQLLRTLKRENRIQFDMHPDTRRDFVPVEVCARRIVRMLTAGVSGVYNLGAGFPVRCGDIADWVMEGFRGGRLEFGDAAVRDEFFLNMDSWSTAASDPLDMNAMREYCVELGEGLKCARY
jgi:nucleoside-diphosphate-sugar epimerase